MLKPEIKFKMSGKYLPFELIENILSRLPVKSLKRFRAVEKSWRHLIDSERFAKIHLHRSLTSISNRNLISGMLGFHWMSVDSLADEAQSMDPGFEYDYQNVSSISNSCNGLVVVMRDPAPLILWNPFSREHKVLPKCPRSFVADSSVPCKTKYGFGYDSENDDYKVIQVMLYEKPFSWTLSEEWIYSLKANCWRRTDGAYYDRGNWPEYVNGALHSIVQNGSDSVKIMGFSVVTEKDYEVAMPEGFDMKGLRNVCLDEFDGCLALVCNYSSRVVIFVMEEYGVKESWIPLVSYPIEADEIVRALAYSNERDKVVLFCGGKGLALYDVRSRKSVKNFVMPLMFWPQLCVESLISPNGWTEEESSTENQNKDGQPNKEKEKMMEKKKKQRNDFLSVGFKLVL